MGEPLPILVADLADDAGLAYLAEIARQGGDAWVPLVAAPAYASRHLLELYTPTRTEPMRLLADPLGPPGEHGFPLRLYPLDDFVSTKRAPPSAPPRRFDTPTQVHEAPAPRRARFTLTPQHAADLAGRVLAGDSDTRIGRCVAEKFVLEERVEAGVMGTLYRARHTVLGVASLVRVLDDSFQHDVDYCRRFHAEQLAVSRLDHANIVRIVDFGQEADGLLYLATDDYENLTLDALLEREGPLSTRRIVEIATQICAAVAHAHAREVVHRDLRPASVLVLPRQDDDGLSVELARVRDFAVAPLRLKSSPRPLPAAPECMAPECCRGEAASERSDVYSMGVVLFRMATGRAPFESDKPIVVVNRHLSAPPPALREVCAAADPRLEAIVARALQKSPEARHSSMRDLRADLKELASTSNPPPPSRPSMRAAFVPASPPMPPVSLPPPQGSQPPRAPDWLVDRRAGHVQFLEGLASGLPPRTEELALALSRDPTSWLAALAEQRDPRAFSQSVDELDVAVRVLAERGDAKALWAISSTLHGLVSRPSVMDAFRASVLPLLRLFTDPAMLGPTAERLLSGGFDGHESARNLLVQAKVAGAYALYGARVKYATVDAVRVMFVRTMREIGDAALPVLRAALERIPEAAFTGEHPLAAALAEDLLLSVPRVRDEAAGLVAAKYLHTSDPALARAATYALARLWGDRAQPVLLQLLDQGEEGVRVMALAAIREIGAFDPVLLRRLAPVLLRQAPGGPSLRRAAFDALAATAAAAKEIATPILVQLVRNTPEEDDAVVLDACRVLLDVVGNPARAVIIERCDRSREPLRTHLLELLKDPALP